MTSKFIAIKIRFSLLFGRERSHALVLLFVFCQFGLFQLHAQDGPGKEFLKNKVIHVGDEKDSSALVFSDKEDGNGMPIAKESFKAYEEEKDSDESKENQGVLGKKYLSFENSRHRLGLLTGYGDQAFGPIAMTVNYHYDAYFIQGQYYFSFKNTGNWNLEGIAIPQYQITRYRPVDEETNLVEGFEAGVNIGLLARRNFFDNHLSLYGMIAVGPQYVSGTPERQADGFIFTDNFFIGANVEMYKDLYLDLRPGFRHMSNAGLKSPNKGINNFVFYIGILYNLKNRTLN